MFIFLYFLYFVTSVRANDDVLRQIFYNDVFSEVSQANVETGYSEKRPIQHSKCDTLDDTRKYPFIVIILYKTSGRFMGMGGIIDSRTVITSEPAVKLSYDKPDDILVLAGYLSPWWGKNSQVRKGENTYSNEYELVLLKIKPDWKFNDRVQPIQFGKLSSEIKKTYESNFLLFGIPTAGEFNPGDEVSKTLVYSSSKHTPTSENDCGKDYADLKPSFNETTHLCFFGNGSFCAGCVGSPVIGVRKNSLITDLVGVVVRSSCVFRPRQVAVLKLYDFKNWIKYHSLADGE